MNADEVRFEVRRHLAGRPTASLDLDSIHHGLCRKGLECSKEEVAAALAFMLMLEPAQVMQPKSSINQKRWQITAPGIVAHENND